MSRRVPAVGRSQDAGFQPADANRCGAATVRGAVYWENSSSMMAVELKVDGEFTATTPKNLLTSRPASGGTGFRCEPRWEFSRRSATITRRDAHPSRDELVARTKKNQGHDCAQGHFGSDVAAAEQMFLSFGLFHGRNALPVASLIKGRAVSKMSPILRWNLEDSGSPWRVSASCVAATHIEEWSSPGKSCEVLCPCATSWWALARVLRAGQETPDFISACRCPVRRLKPHAAAPSARRSPCRPARRSEMRARLGGHARPDPVAPPCR